MISFIKKHGAYLGMSLITVIACLCMLPVLFELRNVLHYSGAARIIASSIADNAAVYVLFFYILITSSILTNIFLWYQHLKYLPFTTVKTNELKELRKQQRKEKLEKELSKLN